MKLSDPLPQIARINQIARHAGVSTATVDRVLNNRSNVREVTRQRVLQAKAALESGSVVTVASRPWRLKVLLPRNAGPSTDYLSSCIQALGELGTATIECEFTRKMEPVHLARKLRAVKGQGIDGVAFMALQDPRVVDAVADLASANIPCISLMSGLDNARLLGYVGPDNRAAGRTAGLMMGNMVTTSGSLLIVTGGDLYRAHEEREMGFRAVIRRDFSHVGIAASISGQDDIDQTCQAVLTALDLYPDLVGIYNVGGGNEGIVRALKASGTEHEIIFIGNNLTPKTIDYLLEGSMNAVIHKNLEVAAKDAVSRLIAHLNGGEQAVKIMPIEIITRENTAGVVFS